MTIKLTFLGTSDAIPTAKRNHPSILLTYEGENILVDCGEGTQRQFRKAGLNPLRVTRLLITHWHGDHVLGIPGLLETLSSSGYNRTLFVYGPLGTKKFMDELMRAFVFVKNFNLEVKEITKAGKFLETKDFYLESEKMTHGPPTNAYSFVKKGNLRIDKSKLKKLKITPGKHLMILKQGKDMVYNGKKYKAKDLTYKTDETKVSFILDTSLNKKILPFVKNSDLLISEATFSEEEKAKANEHKHLISKDIAEIAKKANVKKMFLTHLSQRYEKNPDKILNEARKIFKNTSLANDLESIELK